MKKFFLTIQFLSASILLLVFGSCSELDNLFKKPEAQIVSVSITKVDFSSVSFLVNLEITNPNPVGITLSSYDYILDSYEKNLLSGRIEKPVSLKANGISTIPIPIEIEYENILSLGSSFRTSKSIPVNIALGLEIDFPYMGGVRLDLTGDTEIPILMIPSIRAESIQVDELSFSGAQISLSLNIQNPNHFALSINSAEGRLLVSSTEWGNMGTGETVSIPPQTESDLNLTMQVDFAEAGRSAWALLTGGRKADIRFEGDMDIVMDIPSFSGRGIPFSTDAKVSILR